MIAVDDDDLLYLLKTQLASTGYTVNTCPDGNSLMKKLIAEKPNIVLLDINLPQGSGMDAVPLIREFAPASKIIAVSMHNQSAYAKKMLQMGINIMLVN